MKSPIFLFSLPRSGSTLLQRVLMGHKDIASVAEPWIMIPFSYAFKKEGVATEYSHITSYAAMNDFIFNLPKKEDDYFDALGTFAKILYEKQCLKDERYFLDKTPRYYFIIPEIAKAFPEAKFIFLFRNPVHVMSSIIQTWSDGNLRKLFFYDRDLYYGPKALSDGYNLLKDKAYAIQYEEYVVNPDKYTKELCEYLEIDFDIDMLNEFTNQDTKGRLGDPTGVKEYKSISVASLDKWKKSFTTKFRKNMIKSYIKSFEDEVFETQGYNKGLILKEIESLDISNKYFFKDRLDYGYSLFVRYTKAHLFFGKSGKKWARNKYLS